MQSNDETSRLLFELNDEQKDAVLCEHKRLLVLAGAGTGKTKTLIQKILYLIFEINIHPSQILALTFSKNAAYEMIDRMILSADSGYENFIYDKTLPYQDRISKRYEYIKKYPWLSNITINTFHGLCYQTLKNYGAKEFDNKFKMLTDPTFDENIEYKNQANETPESIMQKMVFTRCMDAKYLFRLKRYVLDYYVDNFRKKMHEKGRADYKNPFTTLKGDHVKSKSERDIADWLYRHNIDYEYEPLIAPGRFEFSPDFYIKEANTYLELISNLSHPIKHKEQQMNEAGKVYLKVREHETHDSNEFNAIMDKLIVSRIDRDLHNIPILNISEEFRGYDKYLRYFILDSIRVMDKVKVENKNFDEIYEKGIKDEHERIRDFYEIVKPLIYDYEKYCINHSYLDFNDLLLRTVSLFENHPETKRLFQNKYQYVLVDEFQDVNSLQVTLIKQLLTNENQLFCVGDDWQSIYGWRGSNVEYIINFEKFFDKSKLIKLELNYRSNSTIVNASNEVINNNKYKIDKELRSLRKTNGKIHLYSANKEEEDGVRTVIGHIKTLLDNGFDKEDILVLTRTRKSDAYPIYSKELRKLGVRIITMHQGKGLEAKIVFIIGLTGGYHGFPNVRDTDRIFQIIKQSNFELLMEEERRLFYVALTRAKKELFLISEVGNESEFIREIPIELLHRTNSMNEELDKSFINADYDGEIIETPSSKKNKTTNMKQSAETPIKMSENTPINVTTTNDSDKNSKKYSVKDIRKPHPNAYELWTKDDDDRLINEYLRGKSIKELMELFGRQKGGIESRLKKLTMK